MSGGSFDYLYLLDEDRLLDGKYISELSNMIAYADNDEYTDFVTILQRLKDSMEQLKENFILRFNGLHTPLRGVLKSYELFVSNDISEEKFLAELQKYQGDKIGKQC